MEKAEKVNIELRSEDIQDILNRAPNWMISWGNSIVFMIILGGFALSYFIKYPDVITGTAVVSTDQPPLYLLSNVDGRISKILIGDGEEVDPNQVLIELENPVDIEDIKKLEELIQDTELFLKNPSKATSPKSVVKLNLYEANRAYLQLVNTINAYENFLFNKNSFAEREELKQRLSRAKELYAIGQNELELSKQEIDNAKQKFAMQEEEYQKGYTTKLNFLNAQSSYIQILKQEENLKKAQLNLDMSIFNLQAQIDKFERDRLSERTKQEQSITEGLSGMKNFITSWENDYTIKSPAKGKVEFLARIRYKQLINRGDEVMALIQEEESFEVIAIVPRTGFGKVEIGNRVKLKVDNYPFEQFGILNGEVSSYSSLSKEDEYVVEITLPNELQTTYNQTLKYTPEMSATAEIITEDLRLIERLFNSLRSIFSN